MIRFAAATSLCLVLAACASAPDQVKLPSAPRPGEPAGLIGLTPADMRANFGTPAFVRKDAATELWRYDGAACKAFFFLYPDGTMLHVRHVETVPRGGATAADADCLTAMLAAHRGAVARPVS